MDKSSENIIDKRQNKAVSFYGWISLSGAMLVIFLYGGSFLQSFGVYLPVISRNSHGIEARWRLR